MCECIKYVQAGHVYVDGWFLTSSSLYYRSFVPCHRIHEDENDMWSPGDGLWSDIP